MGVPHVSPENYGRVQAFAQIELGGESPRVEELSFDEQLGVIISNTGGADEPLSVLDEMLKMDTPIHPGWVREVEMTIPAKKSGSGVSARGQKAKKRKQRVEEEREEIADDLSALSVGEAVKQVAEEKRREIQEDEGEDTKDVKEEINIGQVDEAFQGRVKEMPTFRVPVADRSRPHRPEVSERTERALRAAVQELRPRVPAGSFDFDGVLSVFLDELQDRYEEMAIEIKAVEWVQ